MATKRHNKKAEWISNMEKRVKKTQRKTEDEKTHRFTLKNNKKKKIRKRLPIMVYMDSGSKNSPPSILDLLSKRKDAYKKQTYLNG